MSFLPPSRQTPKHLALRPEQRAELRDRLRELHDAIYRGNEKLAFDLVRLAIQVVSEGGRGGA